MYANDPQRIFRVAQRGALADVGPREDQEHDRRRAYEHELFENAGMMALLTMHCHERSPYPKPCRDNPIISFRHDICVSRLRHWNAIAYGMVADKALVLQLTWPNRFCRSGFQCFDTGGTRKRAVRGRSSQPQCQTGTLPSRICSSRVA